MKRFTIPMLAIIPTSVVTLVASLSLLLGNQPLQWPSGSVIPRLANERGAGSPGFVHSCGIHFCVDDKVTFFAGANAYDLFTYGSGKGDTENQYMNKAQIDAQMARMASDGVTVVRTWMFNHDPWHGFEDAKGSMNSKEWDEFDYILYSAHRNGLRIIAALENYWTDYGGVSAVLKWNHVDAKNPGAFFDPTACGACLKDYESYAGYALNRVNHYTGMTYKDDPTIFSWELVNEPRYQGVDQSGRTMGSTFRAWEDKVGAYIKEIDPHHMLDNGAEGQGVSYGYGKDVGVPYLYECQSRYIDFCTAHVYPTEDWSDLSVAQTRSLVARYINDTHKKAGKPFFLGEFNASGPRRQEYWEAIFSAMEEGGGDGDAFWWYEDGVDGSGYGIRPDDPILRIFRSHSAADRRLSVR